jgi:hypothetical protein
MIRSAIVSGAVTLALLAASAAGQAAQPSTAAALPGGQLNGVSCRLPSLCLAVGSWAKGTLAERWNGSSWHVQATPDPAHATGSSLNAVSCRSRRLCIAVGSSSKGLLAERWNGSSWRIQPSPNPAGASGTGFSGVSCSSATSCTAVGSSAYRALAERWNGARWRAQHAPNPGGRYGSSLSGVSCRLDDACTAVGSVNSSLGTAPLAERWNGTRWSTQPVPNPNGGEGEMTGLSGVSCPSVTACTAVGSSFVGGTVTEGLLEGWNGAQWSVQATPAPGGYGILTSVWCSSATACTAVGRYASAEAETRIAQLGNTLAERWNGTSWAQQQTPSPAGTAYSSLSAVSCPWARACTAVGSYQPVERPVTLAEDWNGASWVIKPTP